MEQLHQFFAGYFHEDWPVEATDPDGVLDAFLAEGQARSTLEDLAALIEEYVDSRPDESLEDSLFTDLGCYYTPSADGQSARAWLGHVIARLRAAATEPR